MKIFVDSGIFVEYIKGRQVDFYEYLITQGFELFINQVVLSEFLFYYIATLGNKSPLSIKESGGIANCFKKHNPLDMLPGIHVLEHTHETSYAVIDLMKRYNLLPNDALIFASCLENQIEYLATFDSDFELPCSNHGIKILKKFGRYEKLCSGNLKESLPRQRNSKMSHPVNYFGR